MRGLICISIPALFIFSLECMNRSSQHSEKPSHSPQRMLNEVLRKSDNCLKEFTRATSTKESSPLRSHHSIQNLDQRALVAALTLPENSSPRDHEVSSSPKKFLYGLFGRSNSRKFLVDPKTSKESSVQGSPREASQSDHSFNTPDELGAQALEDQLCYDDLKRFLRKKMKKRIAEINADKVAPLPADTERTKASNKFCEDPFAKHYIFTHHYKNTKCVLHFIQCSTKKRLLCFINCPLLYE